MPSGWTALKCEGCGDPLEPLSGGFPALLHVDSMEVAEELQRGLSRLQEYEVSYSSIPIVGGDFQMEIVRSPLADLLKCTSCGMLYERESQEEHVDGHKATGS
jgi:hypothetical protein